MAALSERLEPVIMPRPSRRWMAQVFIALLAVALLAWYFMRQTLPREIRIATGAPHGMYSEFAHALGDEISRKSGRPVKLIETGGSVENRTLLADGKADL